jgi:hypothetical protein
MIESPDPEYFEKLRLQAHRDPRYHAEEALLDLTEKICEAHGGQPRGIYKHLFHLMQWCAGRLIWGKKK